MPYELNYNDLLLLKSRVFIKLRSSKTIRTTDLQTDHASNPLEC